MAKLLVISDTLLSFCGSLRTKNRHYTGKFMAEYYVYILSNPYRTLYIGVTNNLKRRIYEHKKKLVEGFTQKYDITRLVYFEQTTDIRSAIHREKQLKGWVRTKKNYID